MRRQTTGNKNAGEVPNPCGGEGKGPGNDFRAGVAVCEIRYPEPALFRLLGMPQKSVMKARGGPIRVEALALACGADPVLVVTYDFPANRNGPDAMPMREAIAARTGCDPGRIIFSGTHCHSSWYVADPSGSERAKRACAEFEAGVGESIMDACAGAVRAMKPAETAHGRVSLEGKVSECRRMVVSNGTVWNCWGGGSVALPGVKFFGRANTVDESVDFLAFRRVGEKTPFAVLTGYGSHIHLLPVPYANAEVAGWVKAGLEERFPGLKAMYATHAAGDATMRTIESPPVDGTEAGDWAWQKRIGREMAGRFNGPLVAALERAMYGRPEAVKHAVDISGTGGMTPPLSVVHALAVGDVGLVNFKPELFTHYGREIRRRSPFSKMVLLGYNESDCAYVGTPLNLEQGGYEMSKANTGRPEIGEMTVEKAVALLERVRG